MDETAAGRDEVTKTNPTTVIAIKLTIDGVDHRAFNAAMRKEFPHITVHALREARQNAKVLLAIRQVTHKEDRSC
jgi:hypothetical protein